MHMHGLMIHLASLCNISAVAVPKDHPHQVRYCMIHSPFQQLKSLITTCFIVIWMMHANALALI